MIERTLIKSARVSYPHVFSPETGDVNNGKYTVSLLVPKGSEDARNLEALVKKIKEDNKAMFAKGDFSSPLIDGDLKDCPGVWIIRAKTAFKPTIYKKISGEKRVITDEDEFYGGCWCAAIINLTPYYKNAKKGITCSFSALMKTRDGERFAGGDNASEFDQLADTEQTAEGAEEDLL